MSLLKIQPFSIDSANTFTFANANVIANLNTGNANLGNLATANFFSGNGSLLTAITGANVIGTVSAATTAGTVTTNAQPNITSTGTLTGLTVSNSTGTVNFTGTGNITLGTVANLHIGGGTSGYVLSTDGSGGLTWISSSSASGNANISGSNTHVFFNDNGSNTLGSSANFAFDKSTKTLTVDNITANGSGLTSITGANVTGAVAYATTANAVAGANVSGAVSYATTANSVAGANVSGAVGLATYATTANAVAGANVSGAVSYATTANAVAGANVSGEVTYAATANSVAGANVSGQVSNALIAGTVYTASQPNITSVGTLSSVVVTGNANVGNLNATTAVIASTLTSNVATGTAPLTITSTTRVANLSVAYANVSDYSVVTTQTTGTFYPVFVNGGTTANYSLSSNTALSYDAATGTLTTGNISAGSGSGGNITGANLISANYFSGSGNLLSNIQGANVTGAVGLATYATTANAVAGANVSGAVAYATTANAVAGANVSGAVAYATTANAVAGANVSGQVSNALVAGTVYTAAQPNITSVGTLSSVVVTGNANVGNLIATGLGSFGANVNLNSNHINNVADPQLDQDAATKKYVDGLVSTGLYYHSPVIAATSTTLATATGGTITYNNGTAGVNANLVTTGSFDLIDTANVQTVGTRILVKNEANAAWNGIYTWANATTIVRSTDADSYGTGTGDLSLNDYFFVSGGSTNKGIAYVVTTTGTITFGTTNLDFTQFSTSQVYSAGQGLTLTDLTFNVNNAQPNITSVGLLTGLTVGNLTSNIIFGNGTVNATGNINAAFYFGDGSQLTGVSATTATTATSSYKLANGTSNVDIASLNGNVTVGVAGNAAIITVTGTGVNIAGYANLGTGNIIAGNANLGNLVTSNYFAGVLTTAAQPNITSIGTLSSLGVTGTITSGNANLGNATTANYFIGNLYGTANLATYATTANAVAGANVSGEVSFAATANAVAGANVSGAVSYATTANAVAGANVSGEVTYAATANSVAGANVSGTVSAATTAGTVTTAAQPNITSTGTLSNLTVSGNVAFSGANVTLGAVANLHIGGGSANYYLQTDGSGALTWAEVPMTSVNVDTFTGDGSWTMKTLTVTPTSINYTLVMIGGVFQPRDAYSVSTNVITFDDPPPNGAIVEITTVVAGGAAGGGGGSSWTYSAITANTAAVAGYRYIVDTSSANITITLPSTATLGDEVMIIDGTGNASTHEITVGRNGGKIQGDASDMTVTTDRAAFTLVYYNSTQGWLLTNV